jgi:peptidoglycan/xylan/chitin deacetylase (PgdA/CDA1 family)
MEFLDWDDCRELVAAGMTIGSHTKSHRVLVEQSDAEVKRELQESKETIERELGTACDHFCAPVGRPDVDFRTDRDYELARRVGYRSFLTTQRGSVHRTSTPMAIERDHTLAIWGLYQLRYFFSQ